MPARHPWLRALRDQRSRRRAGGRGAVLRGAQLEKDVGQLRAQLETLTLFNEQQRALMSAKARERFRERARERRTWAGCAAGANRRPPPRAQVSETVQELKAPGKKCKWCGPRVCAAPVVNKVVIQ